jgi:hypothetical protein
LKATLLPRPAFISAVNECIAWLGENRPEDQLDHFLFGLTWVRDRIAERPGAGPIVRQDAHHVLRLRLFPKPLPYLVYYAHPRRDPLPELYLVRLYGSGQRRQRLSMSGWPW